MLIYEKVVNDRRKLFGTFDNIPSDDDKELTYKDETGVELTLEANDTYIDRSKEGTQFIRRVSDNKEVNVFIGDVCIIGENIPAPVILLESITLDGPSKKEYLEGDNLDISDLEVTAHYSDSSEKKVTTFTTYPAITDLLTPDNTEVTVSYTEDEITKTASYRITVTPKNVEPINSSSEE